MRRVLYKRCVRYRQEVMSAKVHKGGVMDQPQYKKVRAFLRLPRGASVQSNQHGRSSKPVSRSAFKGSPIIFRLPVGAAANTTPAKAKTEALPSEQPLIPEVAALMGMSLPVLDISIDVPPDRVLAQHDDETVDDPFGASKDVELLLAGHRMELLAHPLLFSDGVVNAERIKHLATLYGIQGEWWLAKGLAATHESQEIRMLEVAFRCFVATMALGQISVETYLLLATLCTHLGLHHEARVYYCLSARGARLRGLLDAETVGDLLDGDARTWQGMLPTRLSNTHCALVAYLGLANLYAIVECDRAARQCLEVLLGICGEATDVAKVLLRHGLSPLASDLWAERLTRASVAEFAHVEQKAIALLDHLDPIV